MTKENGVIKFMNYLSSMFLGYLAPKFTYTFFHTKTHTFNK